MTPTSAIRLSTASLLIFLLSFSATQASDEFWDPTFGPQGMNGFVYSIVLDGVSDVYAGGRFTKAGDLDVGYVARWDGASWSDVGGGVGGPDGYHEVRVLFLHEGILYAGGLFQGAGGGASATNVARWDGAAWTGMGTLDGPVYDFEVFDGEIYACGDFEKSGSVILNGIARWDGVRWRPLDLGLRVVTNPGTGKAMDAGDTHLYVGGDFTKAGSITAIKTARWDGAAWSTGTGILQGYVEAMLVDGAVSTVAHSVRTPSRRCRRRSSGWGALSHRPAANRQTTSPIGERNHPCPSSQNAGATSRISTGATSGAGRSSLACDDCFEINLRPRVGVDARNELEAFQDLERVLAEKLADIAFAVTIDFEPALLIDTF